MLLRDLRDFRKVILDRYSSTVNKKRVIVCFVEECFGFFNCLIQIEYHFERARKPSLERRTQSLYEAC